VTGAPDIGLGDTALVADRSGALWWPARGVLAVADLHLEKGSAFARKGALLPPYDTVATLRRLGEAIGRLAPRTVVCLGDSFHDTQGPERLDAGDAAALSRLMAGRDWVWVAGNHDPEIPAGLGGHVVAEYAIDGLAFRHEALLMTRPGEVSGHFHPKAAVRVRGKRLSGRCFVADARRLVLPAFGAYTGGLSVRDPAIARLFPEGFTAWLIGPRKVYAFPGARLVG
jgi:DNA ligase-associated metallophosphoesterase